MKGILVMLLILAILAAWVLTASGIGPLAALDGPSLDERGLQAQGTLDAVWMLRTATTAASEAMAAEQALAQSEEAMEATRQASAATQVVLATETAQAWQATAAADVAQSTATAQAGQAALVWTQEAVDRQATVDAASADALATVQAVQAAQAVEALRQEQIRTEMRFWTRRAWAMTPFVALIGAAAIGVWGTILMMKIRVIPRGVDGASPVIIIDGKVVNADRAPGAVLDPRQAQLPGQIEQLRVTENEQKVAAIRALALSGRSMSATRMAGSMGAQASGGIPQEEALPSMASWDSLANWHGGRLPLGIGSGQSGIALDPEKVPHLLVAGTSGAGKTMSGLRPIATLALASGWQLVILNEKGGDFAPLKSHPNVITIPGGANEVVETLEAVAHEVERRSKVLNEAGISTWSRMTDPERTVGPRIMIMIDELVALAQMATGNLSGRIWRAAIHITSKGRSMGLMFVAATTDPTYRTLAQQGLIVRDNCGRMVFRLRDMSSSMAALNAGGAESLTEHQFIAQLDGGPVRGAAFCPSDDEIRAFLRERSVPVLPKPEWLTEQEDGGVELCDDIMELAEQIRTVWMAGGSKRAMARAAGGEYAGAMAGKIDEAIEYLVATTTQPVAIHRADQGQP